LGVSFLLRPYRPASLLARQRMSVSQRRRLGIPDGHVQIYGEHIPDEHADPLRYWAYWIAWKMGRPWAERFVKRQKYRGYPDIAFIRDQWDHKRDASANREIIRAIRRACCGY
jgi:hypothetical protein